MGAVVAGAGAGAAEARHSMLRPGVILIFPAATGTWRRLCLGAVVAGAGAAEAQNSMLRPGVNLISLTATGTLHRRRLRLGVVVATAKSRHGAPAAINQCTLRPYTSLNLQR
jgi:hypothetical protein